MSASGSQGGASDGEVGLLTKARLLTLRSIDPYRLILLALILVYVWIFAGLAFDQHAGMRTHKADLGQIDQAIWNSSRGRFVENTDNGFIATRMTDHVEPILALISPVFWLWNDVRAILLLQVIAVAAGAWLLYELTLTLFIHILPPDQRAHIWRIDPIRQVARPLALTLAVAYLLAPQLQSAILTEFHAVPLAAPLILWALWSVERRRWLQFAIAALLVAAVKEETALLAAGLGVWAMWRETKLKIEDLRLDPEDSGSDGEIVEPEDNQSLIFNLQSSGTDGDQSPISNLQSPGIDGDNHSRGDQSSIFNLQFPGIAVGLLITLLSLTWFAIATFVIVPAHAVAVYGVAESGYFARYGALGNSPLDIFKSFFTQPRLVWSIASEPVRVRYLIDLIMGFGFLTLLGPELLLIALPVLLANLLSAYPAQYYGEFHYSAPLIPYVAAGAAFGLTRLWRWLARRTDRSSAAFQHMPAAGTGTMALASLYHNSRTAVRPLLTVGLIAWILAWSLVAYAQRGRGPLGGRYDPTPVSAHARLLERFVDQIPADAAVTATAAVHPHVSHRRYVYQFPMGLEAVDGQLGNAEWALIDVTTNTDMAPGDVKLRVEQMLAGDWGVVDGADGFLLLHKGAAEKGIPDAFYDFARGESEEIGEIGDGGLAFVGLEVEDWPRWRQTKLIGSWRVGAGFDPQTDAPRLWVNGPGGETVYASDEITPPALIWYGPERWRPGETIRITTLPLYLPGEWGVVANHAGGRGLPVENAAGDALIATYQRTKGDRLVERPLEEATIADFGATAQAWAQGGVTATEAVFQLPDGGRLRLQAWLAEANAWPGGPVNVWLQWRREGDGAKGWPAPLTPFVHLRQGDENRDQSDGPPRYFALYPLDSVWTQQGVANDWRQLWVPEDLPAEAVDGEPWRVVVGLYDPQTGQRADVIDESGTPVGNEVEIGQVKMGQRPQPDQTCALNAAACKSQR